MSENMNSKLVFSPLITRHLLKMGNKIIDIKADKNDTKRTVFVFLKDAKFEQDFNTVLNEIADERLSKKSRNKREYKNEKE